MEGVSIYYHTFEYKSWFDGLPVTGRAFKMILVDSKDKLEILKLQNAKYKELTKFPQFGITDFWIYKLYEIIHSNSIIYVLADCQYSAVIAAKKFEPTFEGCKPDEAKELTLDMFMSRVKTLSGERRRLEMEKVDHREYVASIISLEEQEKLRFLRRYDERMRKLRAQL